VTYTVETALLKSENQPLLQGKYAVILILENTYLKEDGTCKTYKHFEILQILTHLN